MQNAKQGTQGGSNYFKTNPYDDTFVGWTPDVQVLTENDLKKIEK
jgi:hypothetical protein